MKNLSRNVSFPNQAPEISFGSLPFINVIDSKLIILPHFLQEEFLQFSQCVHTNSHSDSHDTQCKINMF